jgi:hypothetical protein
MFYQKIISREDYHPINSGIGVKKYGTIISQYSTIIAGIAINKGNGYVIVMAAISPQLILKKQDFYRLPTTETAQIISLLHSTYRFYAGGTIYAALCILHRNTIVKCRF